MESGPGNVVGFENNIGTIKDFVYYSMDLEKQLPDFTMMKDAK